VRTLVAITLLALATALPAAAQRAPVQSAPLAATDRYFVTSDGVRLHYIEAGRGRTIVLVPGWTMPAWIWDAQIRDFARFYHVVAFDPRSQGDSEVAPSGYEPVRRGQDIAELIEHLGPQPVLLVGWPMSTTPATAGSPGWCWSTTRWARTRRPRLRRTFAMPRPAARAGCRARNRCANSCAPCSSARSRRIMSSG
jgi:pimeloyl-ACP methyl ester carboxylesterase